LPEKIWRLDHARAPVKQYRERGFIYVANLRRRPIPYARQLTSHRRLLPAVLNIIASDQCKTWLPCRVKSANSWKTAKLFRSPSELKTGAREIAASTVNRVVLSCH